VRDVLFGFVFVPAVCFQCSVMLISWFRCSTGGSGVDATVGEGRFNPATSSCNISRVRSRNSILPGISAAGVSPAEGCNDGDECFCKDESRRTRDDH